MNNTSVQLRNKGITLLLRELGPVDAVRFLQQFDSGYGDYTEERRELLKDETVDSIVARIQSQQSSEKIPQQFIYAEETEDR